MQVSAIHLSLSPAKLEFNGSINQEICNKLKIHTDFIGNILGEIKFGENYFVEDKIENFKLKPEFFNIRASYAKKIYFKGEDRKEIEVCINADKEIKNKGIIIYQTDGSYGAIASKIYVNIDSRDEYRILKVMIIILFLILIALLIINYIITKKVF